MTHLRPAGSGAARTHATARELAGLPGMPARACLVRRLATRLGWDWRSRPAGRAREKEYAIEALPARTLAAIIDSARPSPQPSPASRAREQAATAAWAMLERGPRGARREAARRLAALVAVEARTVAGEARGRALRRVAAEIGEGAGTVRRWLGLVAGVARADWLAAVAPGWAGRAATAACSVAAWDTFKSDYLSPERACAAACHERLKRAAAGQGWTVPALKTLMRRLRRELHPAAIARARAGADAAKRMHPAQERDRAAFKALEAVNADGHTIDVFVRREDGVVGRPVLLAVQDLFSGKMLALREGRAESAHLVRLALADVAAEFGLPERIYLDNGRAFASKWITGGIANRYRFTVKAEEPLGVLPLLGVEVHWTKPYSGQSKPIERAFRDFAEYLARHPAFAGAYVGNNPTAKPENYGSRAVPIGEFRLVLAEELAAHNARAGRRSAVCAGRSFDAAFAEGYGEALVRKATAAQRRMLLLAAEGVTCNRRDSSIRLFGNRYWTDDAGLARLAGRKVVVRFDPDRLHEPVHVYSLDGRYVATCDVIERTGFGDTEAGKAWGRSRGAWMKAIKTQLDAERRMSRAEVAALLPRGTPPAAPVAKVVRPVFAGIETARPKPAGGIDRETFDANVNRRVERIMNVNRSRL